MRKIMASEERRNKVTAAAGKIAEAFARGGQDEAAKVVAEVAASGGANIAADAASAARKMFRRVPGCKTATERGRQVRRLMLALGHTPAQQEGVFSCVTCGKTMVCQKWGNTHYLTGAGADECAAAGKAA